MLRGVLQSGVLMGVLAGALFGAAGRLDWPMAWAFLGVFLAFILAAFLLLDPELVRERSRAKADGNTRDVSLATLGAVFLYPGTLAVAGFDARYEASPSIPLPLQISALGVFFLGYAFAFWAMRVNRFFSTFVRLQSERGHHLVSRGPYALVRHPGYAGMLLAHLLLPFALGSVWALLPALVGALLFGARTAAEDRTLSEVLPGYRAYRSRVRWRLLPGVW